MGDRARVLSADEEADAGRVDGASAASIDEVLPRGDEGDYHPERDCRVHESEGYGSVGR